MKTESLEPTTIRQVPDCQPRAEMDDRVVEGLVDLLDGGDDFNDPIVVFQDSDGTLRLVDGFHRLKAHLVWCERHGDVVDINAEVHAGDEQAAITFAVRANSAHGMRRNSADLRRAFEIAIRHEIVDKKHSSDVQAKLGCSLRAAQRLTGPYRKSSKTRRDDQIVDSAQNGQTQEQIADQVGVNKGTVSRVLHSRQLARVQHPDTTGPTGATPGAESLSNGGGSDDVAPPFREAVRPGDTSDVAETGPTNSASPFDRFEASIRGFYKDIGTGMPVPRTVRDMARHCKSCFQAAQAGEVIPDELLVLLDDFVRHSKNHVV